MIRNLTLFITLSFSLLTFNSIGSHMMGGDLTYKCLGGMDHEVTLTFYRDCSGINAPQSAQVEVSSNSCGLSTVHALPLISALEVDPGCSNWQTTCNGGSVPGVEMYYYRDTITFGGTCADWVISHELCCRNAIISNLVDPSTQEGYYEATLDNLNFTCNSSPVFQEQPAYIICLGQSFCVNNTAYEPDGDSLVYEMVDPLGASGVPLAFAVPYSAMNPLPSSSGINFDAMTGNLCVTPSALGSYVVNFKVSEYRNGMLIGSTMRDMQLWVASCGTTATYNISGTVSDTDSVAVNSGIVDLFEYDLNMGSMNLHATQVLGAGGTYSFSGVPYGQYIIRATPDTIDYPNRASTYHWNTFYWSYANVLSAFCDSSFIADVTLVGYGNLSGSGYMGGYLGELGVRSTVGDPFPNIGVLIIRTTDNVVVASTFTDANGEWVLNGLPDGDYKVVIDEPGLSMISHHYVTIANGNQTHLDLDYLAEPVGIMIAPISTNIHDNGLANSVGLFPNPTNGTISLSFEKIQLKGLKVILMDLSGRHLEEWDISEPSNTIDIDLPDVVNGTYLLQLIAREGMVTKQVNIVR